ncbi:MAG: hypothetical protein QY310_08090 [Candidatus Jettenia sp. CY-1]|nr:MAG: hypothetical protein QY310_08090 [Candidatus Jettenia sp. CY-1]
MQKVKWNILFSKTQGGFAGPASMKKGGDGGRTEAGKASGLKRC